MCQDEGQTKGIDSTVSLCNISDLALRSVTSGRGMTEQLMALEIFVECLYGDPCLRTLYRQLEFYPRGEKLHHAPYQGFRRLCHVWRYK